MFSPFVGLLDARALTLDQVVLLILDFLSDSLVCFLRIVALFDVLHPLDISHLLLSVSYFSALSLTQLNWGAIGGRSRPARLTQIFRPFKLLDQSVVVVVWPLLSGGLLLDQSDTGLHVLFIVALPVHLLEQVEFLFVAGNDLVQLLVCEELTLLCQVLVPTAALSLVVVLLHFLRVFFYQLLNHLLPFLVTRFLVKHAGLDDFVVQVFFVVCTGEDAFFHHRPRD